MLPVLGVPDEVALCVAECLWSLDCGRCGSVVGADLLESLQVVEVVCGVVWYCRPRGRRGVRRAAVVVRVSFHVLSSSLYLYVMCLAIAFRLWCGQRRSRRVEFICMC